MKKLQQKLLILSLLFTIVISCINCTAQSNLPDTWQPDMVLKMTYGGGMRYYSYSIEIKETGSYRLVNDGGKETKYDLSFTKQQLDQLIQFLKTQKFDKIKSVKRDDIVYDMGTTSIILSWGKNINGASVGATETLPKADQEIFNAVRIYIEQFVGKNK